jgi:hypothetical protein
MASFLIAVLFSAREQEAMTFSKRKLLTGVFLGAVFALGPAAAQAGQGQAQARGPGVFPGARGVPFLALQQQILYLQTELETSIADVKSEMDQLQTSRDNADEIAALQAQLSLMESDLESVKTVLSGKQDRVTGSCPEGWSIRTVNEDGSVVCEWDDSGTNQSGSLLRRAVSTTVSPNTTGLVTASCPSGYQAIGGGYSTTSAIDVFSSEPLSTRSWSVKGMNGSLFFLTLSASVICTPEST